MGAFQHCPQPEFCLELLSSANIEKPEIWSDRRLGTAILKDDSPSVSKMIANRLSL